MCVCAYINKQQASKKKEAGRRLPFKKKHVLFAPKNPRRRNFTQTNTQQHFLVPCVCLNKIKKLAYKMYRTIFRS